MKNRLPGYIAMVFGAFIMFATEGSESLSENAILIVAGAIFIVGTICATLWGEEG